MPFRRILSLWFPRLAAERVLRAEPGLAEAPLAVVAETRGALVLASLGAGAEAAGLGRGMTLGDARAILPGLVTRPADRLREGAFLAALARWAGRFSPRVAAEPPDGLMLDITGCARLFGGEAGLAAEVEAAAADLRLTLRLGLADTPGAAWALARYAGAGTEASHAGDAIDQEARATRSRARKRRWERGGPPPGGTSAAPTATATATAPARIAPAGDVLAHLALLPVAALRLGPEATAGLQAAGVVRIGALAALPRAGVARRFGPETMLRLDQALGRVPEPVSPAAPGPVLALRLTLPEPIGREADVLAGLDRLLEPLCDRLRAAGLGARRLQLTLLRVDRGAQAIEARLARPAAEPAAIRPLIALQTGAIDPGFGIEALRLEALATEPLVPRQQGSRLAAGSPAEAGFPDPARNPAPQPVADPIGDPALGDLLGRLGARLGADAVLRLHPADSHIPEKSSSPQAAAFASAAGPWPAPPGPRPLALFPPEPLHPEPPRPEPHRPTSADAPVAAPPAAFRWRGRLRRRAAAFGAERIAPEWWLDDPAWRSGPRDYWRVETEEGERIWIFEARNAGTWFAQGLFP